MANDAQCSPLAEPITQEQFDGLLRRLHGSNDGAAMRYEELRRKLVKFFQWSAHSAAEELADETLDRAARKLHSGSEAILDIEAFTWGIAKRIRQEEQRRNGKTVLFSSVLSASFASDSGASVEALHRKLQGEKELRCLQQCLSRLSRADRELFLAYRVNNGHYPEARARLADKFQVSPSSLRVRVIRLREKLEECVARRLGVASPHPSRQRIRLQAHLVATSMHE